MLDSQMVSNVLAWEKRDSILGLSSGVLLLKSAPIFSEDRMNVRTMRRQQKIIEDKKMQLLSLMLVVQVLASHRHSIKDPRLHFPRVGKCLAKLHSFIPCQDAQPY